MLKQININGIKINYYQAGQGQSLVLLHGWLNNWQGMELMIRELEKKFKVYCLDYPGYGESGDLPNYTLEAHADYLAQLIHKLKIKPVIIGTSLGAWIASVFANKYPKLATAVVLIGSPILKNNLPTNFVFKFYDFILRRPRLYLPFLKMVQSKPYCYFVAKFLNMYRFDRRIVDKYGMTGRKFMRTKTLLQTILDGPNHDLSKLIPKLSLSCLLLWGAQDRMVDFTKIKTMVANLPPNRFETHYLPLCGHVVHFEKPREACKIITDYLKPLSFRT